MNSFERIRGGGLVHRRLGVILSQAEAVKPEQYQHLLTTPAYGGLEREYSRAFRSRPNEVTRYYEKVNKIRNEFDNQIAGNPNDDTRHVLIKNREAAVENVRLSKKDIDALRESVLPKSTQKLVKEIAELKKKLNNGNDDDDDDENIANGIRQGLANIPDVSVAQHQNPEGASQYWTSDSSVSQFNPADSDQELQVDPNTPPDDVIYVPHPDDSDDDDNIFVHAAPAVAPGTGANAHAQGDAPTVSLLSNVIHSPGIPTPARLSGSPASSVSSNTRTQQAIRGLTPPVNSLSRTPQAIRTNASSPIKPLNRPASTTSSESSSNKGTHGMITRSKSTKKGKDTTGSGLYLPGSSSLQQYVPTRRLGGNRLVEAGDQ